MRSQEFNKKHRSAFHFLMICLTAIAFTSVLNACKKEPSYNDKILITGTDVSNVINFTVDGIGSSTALTASASGIVNQDIIVAFKTDTTLLTAYNTKNGTNFRVPPVGSFTLVGDQGTIKAGTNVSSAVALKINNTDNFVDGRNYMIPVSINVKKGNLKVLQTSKTAFIKLNRVITTSVFNTTNAQRMTKGFSNIVSLSKFTFEFRIRVSQFGSGFHISTLGVIEDTLTTNAHTFNLFRFGELSDDINQLQWINNVGKISSKTRFATNTWYSVSCVFDGSTCTMYINGVADGSFAAPGTSFNFNHFFLIAPDQPLPGQLSEVRLWSKALSPGEIQNGYCGVDPATPGLLTYWKFNEGQGNMIHDYSGHGYDFSSGSNTNWDAGVKCPN